jgi:DNA repair protein RecO (recombination protein O)
MLKKDLAVCIRAIDYSETSQIITFFARDAGKFTAIAKGSKRPKSAFDGPIELFAQGRIVYSQTRTDKLSTLTEFSQYPAFTFATRDLFALHCASLAAELVNSGIDDYDPHQKLFDAFIKFLHDLDQTQDALRLLIIFQLNLLKEIGLMPVLDHCSNCKTQYAKLNTHDEFYFSSEANGLICRDCEASFPDKIPVTKTAAAALSNKETLAKKDKKTLKEIEKLLIYHFTNMWGRPLKMAKYVLEQYNTKGEIGVSEKNSGYNKKAS